MQTLNKSAMYEPVLLIDTRVKAVSPEYNSHRMKKCCCEWVFDRKHQACRDLMSHGIALVTKNYHVMMFPELPWLLKTWHRTLSPSIFFNLCPDIFILRKVRYFKWKHQFHKSKGNRLENKNENKQLRKEETESKAEGKEAGVLALCTDHLLAEPANKENHCTWELQGHMQGLHLERSLWCRRQWLWPGIKLTLLAEEEESWISALKPKVIKRLGQIIRHARSDSDQRPKN